MITNFEHITFFLSEEERNLIPFLVELFNSHSAATPIKEPQIIRAFHLKGIKLTGPRLRKLCNQIRAYGILPLIASSKGYYVSYDSTEVKRQIVSLTERSDAILRGAQGLKTFVQ